MNTYLFLDIDATLAHVGNRFELDPPKNSDRKIKEYQDWLDKVQHPKDLLKDTPVAGMQDMAILWPKNRVFYLTSRFEKLREPTEQWLAKNYFPKDIPLLMRPLEELRPSAIFKAKEIEDTIERVQRLENQVLNKFYNVIVIDDDHKGDLEKICLEKEWTFLKSRSGGKVK